MCNNRKLIRNWAETKNYEKVWKEILKLNVIIEFKNLDERTL